MHRYVVSHIAGTNLCMLMSYQVRLSKTCADVWNPQVDSRVASLSHACGVRGAVVHSSPCTVNDGRFHGQLQGRGTENSCILLETTLHSSRHRTLERNAEWKV